MNWGRYVVAAFWSVIALFNFSREIKYKLVVWDEEIYYNVSQNVLDGYWILPRFTLQNHPLPPTVPFLHKPPLAYWIQAIAMAIWGETPAIARMPSVVATAAVVAITVLLVWRLATPLTGALSGGVLVSIEALHAGHAARAVGTDAILLFFGIMAVYALIRAVHSRVQYWWVVAGVAYAGAILTKGVAAAPFGLLVLPYMYVYRADWTWWQFGTMVAVGTVVTLPWFLIVAMRAPDALIHQMILRQVVSRATGEAYVTHEATFGFMRYPYFRRAPSYFAPAVYILPLSAVIGLVRVRISTISPLEVLCWPLAVGTFILYALAGGNHFWYVLPAAVPVATLATQGAVRVGVPIIDFATTAVVLWTERRWS